MIGRRWTVAILCIATAVLLRFLSLGAPGLWLDEGYTAWTAHLPRDAHETARAHDDAPPLYYAIQRILVPALPPEEASLRLLSAAAGVGAVALLVAIPPAPAAAAGAALLMAAAPYGVSYAREARSYALLILWAVLLIAATARVTTGGHRRWLAVVAIAEFLALTTHHVGATLVFGANLAWLLLGRPILRGWLVAQAAAFLAWLPFLIEAMEHWRIHAAFNTWTARFWEQTPVAIAPLLSLCAMSFGARTWPPPGVEHWDWRGAGSTPLSIAVFVTVAILLAAAFRGRTRRSAILAASFTAGPLLVLMFLSALTTPSYILGRTDAVAYAGFILWCAVGLASLPRWPRTAAIAILSISAVLSIATHFPTHGRAGGSDRIVGQAIRHVARPGDWVAWVGLSRPSIDYYLSGGRPGRDGDGIMRIHYPGFFGNNPAAPYPTPGDSLRAWEREAYALRARFEAEAPQDAFLIFVGPLQTGRSANLSAADLPYPGSILAYVMNGTRAIEPIARRHGDGVDVEWIAFRIHRSELIALDELQPVEGAP